MNRDDVALFALTLVALTLAGLSGAAIFSTPAHAPPSWAEDARPPAGGWNADPNTIGSDRWEMDRIKAGMPLTGPEEIDDRSFGNSYRDDRLQDDRNDVQPGGQRNDGPNDRPR